MTKYYIIYKNSKITKLIKFGIKNVSGYLLFKVGKEKHLAQISTEPEAFPVFMGVRELYYVYQDDINTFKPDTGEILSDAKYESWRKYLEEHPEHCHMTQKAKLPAVLEKHHIIEDIQHIVLDGTFLKNLMSKIKGLGLYDWLPFFLAGMGSSIVLLMIIGAVYPDNIFIRIGKA